MQYITTEKRGHLFWIGLNRPDKRNSVNIEMLQELCRAYTIMEDDPKSAAGSFSRMASISPWAWNWTASPNAYAPRGVGRFPIRR
jgi:hypothetical protein